MSKILVPLVVWNLGICFDPESKLVEIREGNASVAHSLDQVLPQRGGKVGPQFDFGHYLPKTMCPSSSPRRSTSFGSAADRKRSASSKKAFSFCCFASRPSSTSSMSIRFALRRRRLPCCGPRSLPSRGASRFDVQFSLWLV